MSVFNIRRGRQDRTSGKNYEFKILIMVFLDQIFFIDDIPRLTKSMKWNIFSEGVTISILKKNISLSTFKLS